MTLKTFGPSLSISEIAGEFSGDISHALSEYYAGGLYVLAGTVGYPSGGGAVLIPSSGTISINNFYGSRKSIVGNSGIITAPPDNVFTSDFIDVALPAGVDLIRFFLVGGGGGGGGNDVNPGGDGGGGSTIASTISTAWAGGISLPRKLRFFIGRGGQPGRSSVDEGSFANPAPKGGHGYPMNWVTRSDFSAFMNSYGVSWDQRGGIYDSNENLTSRTIYFNTAGNHIFQFAADNHVRIELDGVEIASSRSNNDQGASQDNSFNNIAPNLFLTRTISVSTGFHKLSFYQYDNGGGNGYAIRVLSPDGSELWNTRKDISSVGTPAGGNGGYPGLVDVSGQGGAGGSGTKLSIISSSGVEYPISLSGGGGGGGGAGSGFAQSNVSQSGNWMTQGWNSVEVSAEYLPGGDGEFPAVPYASDGGGGGGGGGGIRNNRDYNSLWTRSMPHSGQGGFTIRGSRPSFDSCSDGGESGKSWISPSATKYLDFAHAVTTSQTPNLPQSMPVSLASYGLGASGSKGIDGAAYVDWGVTNASVPASIISRPLVRAGAIFSDIAPLTLSGPVGLRTYTINSYDSSPTFSVDAFGGGGNPGSEYTYSWSGAGASFSSPTSYRTSVSVTPATTSMVDDGSGNMVSTPQNHSGSIRVTVSDGVGSEVFDLYWNTIWEEPAPQSSGG